MLKKIITTIIAILSIFCFTENTFSNNGCLSSDNDPFCLKNVQSDLKPVDDENIKLNDLIVNGIRFLLWFLWLIAVVYWLYWWINILTASSDDEKVKKWKTIILRACLWLVVIFLAYPITRFVIKEFLFNEEKTTSSANP